MKYLQWELWSGCDEKQNAAVCVEGGHIALPHPLPLPRGRGVHVDMFLKICVYLMHFILQFEVYGIILRGFLSKFQIRHLVTWTNCSVGSESG